jgi:hypothetical protein
MESNVTTAHREPWNKRLFGPPLTLGFAAKRR